MATTTNAVVAAFLDNLIPEQDYADALRVHQRTIARYRQQGLPFVMIGGKCYIDAKRANRWIEGRIVERNQPRGSSGRRVKSASSPVLAEA